MYHFVVKLFANRLFDRIFLWYHKYWWVTYLLTLSIIIELLLWILHVFFSVRIQLIPRTFEDLAMALGGLAVITVAVRQHRDAIRQAESNLVPRITRMCGDPDKDGTAFNWDSCLFKQPVINLDLAEANQMLERSLGIIVLPDSIITNVEGYLLKDGKFHIVHFHDRKAFAQVIQQINAAPQQQRKVILGGKQTWASGIGSKVGNSLLMLLDPSPTPISYPGNYYCVVFRSLSGRRYILEEDHNYQIRLSALDERRPSWNTDFISLFPA